MKKNNYQKHFEKELEIIKKKILGKKLSIHSIELVEEKNE